MATVKTSDLPRDATVKDIHQYFQSIGRLTGKLLDTGTGILFKYQYVSPSECYYWPEGGKQVKFVVGGNDGRDTSADQSS